MDFREDEQTRQITMKSSAISVLHHRGGEKAINLIDSPGHVDFCSEVSTAARLSDGAVILIDVCEGIGVQTHAVLRQAWEEGLETCLVFNKIDRLIYELRLSAQEAYDRLRALLSEVNGVISQFRSERFMSMAEAIIAEGGLGESESHFAEEAEEDEADQFRPTISNVAFASSLDGWAFT